MSDFLDRLASRAIGGEGLLMPRLPSLFEPAAGAPVMPPTAERVDASPRGTLLSPVVEATAGKRDHAVSPGIAQPMARAPSRPALPPERLPATTSVEPPAGPAPTLAQPPHSAGRPHSQPRSRGRAFATLPPAVARPSETHMAADVPIASSLQAQHGALLRPSSPVFASSRDTTQASGRSGSPGPARPRAAFSEPRLAKAAEPVIHVSIGRLEVRASPRNAAPPPRRGEPHPDSLDEYLRQRGKASP